MGAEQNWIDGNDFVLFYSIIHAGLLCCAVHVFDKIMWNEVS